MWPFAFSRSAIELSRNSSRPVPWRMPTVYLPRQARKTNPWRRPGCGSFRGAFGRDPPPGYSRPIYRRDDGYPQTACGTWDFGCRRDTVPFL